MLPTKHVLYRYVIYCSWVQYVSVLQDINLLWNIVFETVLHSKLICYMFYDVVISLYRNATFSRSLIFLSLYISRDNYKRLHYSCFITYWWELTMLHQSTSMKPQEPGVLGP